LFSGHTLVLFADDSPNLNRVPVNRIVWLTQQKQRITFMASVSDYFLSACPVEIAMRNTTNLRSYGTGVLPVGSGSISENRNALASSDWREAARISQMMNTTMRNPIIASIVKGGMMVGRARNVTTEPENRNDDKSGNLEGE
jgi:hypothetical protein